MFRLRKIIIFILLLSIGIMSFSFSWAAGSYTINAPLTSGTDLSASEWYATAKSRAMLTISVSIDTLSQISDADSNSYSSFWTNPSWVGVSRNKRQVMVVGYYSSSISTTVLVIIYTPSTGKIEYMPIVSRPAVSDDTAELLCLAAIKNDTTKEFEKNDAFEILSIIADLQK